MTVTIECFRVHNHSTLYDVVPTFKVSTKETLLGNLPRYSVNWAVNTSKELTIELNKQVQNEWADMQLFERASMDDNITLIGTERLVNNEKYFYAYK